MANSQPASSGPGKSIGRPAFSDLQLDSSSEALVHGSRHHVFSSEAGGSSKDEEKTRLLSLGPVDSLVDGPC